MADRINQAWNEVGDGFAALGRRLSEHYEQVAKESEGTEEREEIKKAVQNVTDQVDRALTSVGDTIRDPRAKEDLDRAVKSLGNALATTFSGVADEIRTRMGSGRSEGPPGNGSGS